MSKIYENPIPRVSEIKKKIRNWGKEKRKKIEWGRRKKKRGEIKLQ